MINDLPPGQKESSIFPRFGLTQYANRFPDNIDTIDIAISGDGLSEENISEEMKALNAEQQTSDFHCVTTWSKSGLEWEGVKFKTFYEQIVRPKVTDQTEHKFVVFKAQDGYKTGLLLEDLLQDDVMLVDKLSAEPLSIEHGAPIRLIAPKHYGYKNLKHLYKIEFFTEVKKVKQGYLSFMDHPRARVMKEERAVGGPGWFFRYLYRPLIKGTVKDFDKAMKKYYAQNS